MCTGLELALIGGGVGGNLISANQAQRQADEVALAQNQQLTDFLTRNRKRADEASAIFNKRVEDSSPEATKRKQAEVTDERSSAMYDAIASSPAAAAPVKASAAPVVREEQKEIGEREMGKTRSRADALATTSGFGDLVFGMGLDNMDAGRRIAMINDLGAADSQMLGPLQDLAGAEASIRKRPSMFGPILSGIGTAGSYYMGNKAGAR